MLTSSVKSDFKKNKVNLQSIINIEDFVIKKKRRKRSRDNHTVYRLLRVN